MKLNRLITFCLKCVLPMLMFFSCGDEGTTIKEIDIHIVVIGDKEYSRSIVETNVKDFLHYIKSETCNDTIFFPKLKLTKLDKNKNQSKDITIKRSFINEIKASAGTLAPANLMTDYDEEIPKIKLPDFLFTDSNIETSVQNLVRKYKVDYNYSLQNVENTNPKKGVYYNSKSIIEDIKKRICTYKKSSFTILFGNEKKEVKEEDSVIVSTNSCEVESIPSGEDLRNTLLKIIDVSKTEAERIQVANSVWNTYFTNTSYVAKYINKTDKYPKYFGPNLGQGKIYFVERLARYNSILNLSIIDIEYSNKIGEETKISGLHIIECHNKNRG